MPHAPYLVMMGVGEFKKVTDEPWNGKEISYYVEKEFEPHAKAIFGKTKKMIEELGYETIEVDTSEFRKLDGGLSCLSLRF